MDNTTLARAPLTHGTYAYCTACGTRLSDPSKSDGSSTIVHERDKEFTLVHCPRCGTLLVRVRQTPVYAR